MIGRRGLERAAWTIALALVACSPAGADPSAASHRAPAGWQQLHELASAVGGAAKADGVTVDGSDAWGEPAMGCYAVWLDLHAGSAEASALADQVLAGLTGITTSNVVKPSGSDGVLALGFEKPPYRGRLRAHLAAGRITAIACFANRREPAACDAACTQVLQGVP